MTRQERGRRRLPQGRLVARRAPHGKRSNRWQRLRPRQRAVLRGADETAIPKRWGLWLDRRKPDCGPDPFENATKYPGVKTGSRGTTVNGQQVPVGSFYGYATGIVGLRLFPNPAFDERRRPSGTPRSTTSARRRRSRRNACADGGRELFRRQGSRPAVPRRHVVRVLPRRAESDQSAGRSEQSGVGQPELERRRAVLLGRSHLLSGSRTTRISRSSCFTRRGRARSTRRSSRPTTSTTRGR